MSQSSSVQSHDVQLLLSLASLSCTDLTSVGLLINDRAAIISAIGSHNIQIFSILCCCCRSRNKQAALCQPDKSICFLSPQFLVPLWPPASVIMSTWMWKGETLEGNDTFFNFFQHQTARVHHQLLALSNSSWLYGCCGCHHCKGYDLASFVCEEARAITDWFSCKHKRSVTRFEDNHLLL